MSEETRHPPIQFGLSDLLLAMLAVGLWITFFTALANATVSAPIIAACLLGIMAAIHVLFRGRKHAWSVSAILAPLVAGLCLIVAASLLQS
jgi:hypothetical protein